MYFSTNRGTCEQTERKQSECMNVMGTEREALTERLVPIFFVTIKEKQFTILHGVKTAHLVRVVVGKIMIV